MERKWSKHGTQANTNIKEVNGGKSGYKGKGVAREMM